MNRLNSHVDAALQRVRLAAEQAAERGAEGLGLAALSSGQAKRRDALLSAQFIFRKHQALFSQRFDQSMRQQAAEAPGAGTPGTAKAAPKATQWDELSLMDDDQVNTLVATDRIGLALGHQSEWELREVNSYMGDIPGVDEDRHPLRPQAIAQALIEAVNAVTDDPDTRQVLTDELTRALSLEMRACYADVAGLFRSRGLRPQDLRVRGVSGATRGQSLHGGTTSGVPLHDSRYATLPGALHPAVHGSRAGGLHSVAGGFHGAAPDGYATTGGGAVGGMGWSVDPQLMDLMRRLAMSPTLAGPATGGGPLPVNSQWQGWDGDPGSYVDGGPIVLPPNLIHLHRDELRQAASGSLDHMVIDVVAGLFDQILSDAKLPPLMAQQIARLQLPVLRAALGDRSFFSSRRHPVRRLVNRIATLAAAYDDFTDEPGKSFLALVRDLIQDVVSGDFDRMELYESKLGQLEHFIQDQTAQTLKSQGDTAALLERKETELRLQRRYMQQLQQAMMMQQLQAQEGAEGEGGAAAPAPQPAQ